MNLASLFDEVCADISNCERDLTKDVYKHLNAQQEQTRKCMETGGEPHCYEKKLAESKQFFLSLRGRIPICSTPNLSKLLAKYEKVIDELSIEELIAFASTQNPIPFPELYAAFEQLKSESKDCYHDELHTVIARLRVYHAAAAKCNKFSGEQQGACNDEIVNGLKTDFSNLSERMKKYPHCFERRFHSLHARFRRTLELDATKLRKFIKGFGNWSLQ